MSTDKPASATLITDHEAGQIGHAKASGRTPVVFDPLTEEKVDTKDPGGSPLLFISGEGEEDHTVPWGVTNAAFKRQQRNKA
jgi:hypothetical protein